MEIKMAERKDAAHKIAEVLRAASGKTGKKYFTTAVILAAGSSTRMGGDSTKQFLELCGMPVVARTVLEFEKSPLIDEIIYAESSGPNKKEAEKYNKVDQRQFTIRHHCIMNIKKCYSHRNDHG